MRIVVPLLLLLLPAAVSGAPKWKSVTREEGIAVMMREVPGRSFPTFRGIGIVNASVYEVLAVMSDFKRHKDWMERCAETRLLKKINEREYIVYSRTDVPWPISDRDAVFQSKVHIDLKTFTVTAKFWAVKSKRVPLKKGVVRMTTINGHWKLRALAVDKTLMDYYVNADPQGSIPTWLAKLGTRKLPLNTIRNLRKQVKKTRGWYNKRIKRWKSGKY